mmetsp:Transcript_4038/g.10446  ORF Transcript_4038/g.10446 Transcript_4038/m.10446 type:complete len:241 (+) Transcript_4038:54-776(+)
MFVRVTVYVCVCHSRSTPDHDMSSSENATVPSAPERPARTGCSGRIWSPCSTALPPPSLCTMASVRSFCCRAEMYSLSPSAATHKGWESPSSRRAKPPCTSIGALSDRPSGRSARASTMIRKTTHVPTDIHMTEWLHAASTWTSSAVIQSITSRTYPARRWLVVDTCGEIRPHFSSASRCSRWCCTAIWCARHTYARIATMVCSRMATGITCPSVVVITSTLDVFGRGGSCLKMLILSTA